METPPIEKRTTPILNLLIALKNNGARDGTITNTDTFLKFIAKHALLNDPESVKYFVANFEKRDGTKPTNAYKHNIVEAYARYCKHYKIQWEAPTYRPEEASIQPPSNEKCEMLIASAHGKLSLKLGISAETGLRPVEVTGERGLFAKDLHGDERTITPTSAKGCNARPPLKISPELTARLQEHILKNGIKPNQHLFTSSPEKYGDYFRQFRKRLAEKLHDSEIEKIRLYDLRHAYCTKQLRKLQNAEKVRILMGHKRLDTTQKYLHLVGFESGEWEVEFASSKEEAKQLLTADFTYQLTTPDGTMLFKKPK